MEKINDEIISLWEKAIQEASEDGLVFEMLILQTNLEDWNLFIAFIKKNYSYEYFSGKEKLILPKEFAENSFRIDELQFLKIIIDNIIIECTILDKSEIELNIVSATINSRNKIILVLNFLENIALILQKSIVISIEGALNPFYILGELH